MLNGVVQIPLFFKGSPQTDVGPGIVRVNSEGLLVVGYRFLIVALAPQSDSQIVMCIDKVRFEF